MKKEDDNDDEDEPFDDALFDATTGTVVELWSTSTTLLSKDPSAGVAALLADDIEREQTDMATRVALVLQLASVHEGRALCAKHGWDVDRALQSALVDDSCASLPSSLSSSSIPSTAAECAVCGDDGPISRQACSNAEHVFCEQCWRSHISLSLADNRVPECMAANCDAIVPQAVVASLCNKSAVDHLKRLCAAEFVVARKDVRWCPSEGCARAIVLSQFDHTGHVQCACGYEFCFR